MQGNPQKQWFSIGDVLTTDIPDSAVIVIVFGSSKRKEAEKIQFRELPKCDNICDVVNETQQSGRQVNTSTVAQATMQARVGVMMQSHPGE